MHKAIENYQKGTDLNDAFCMYNLGYEYIYGHSIDLDSQKGFELIKAAAEMGEEHAMEELGRCYQYAIGTNRNMEEAVKWYEKTCEVMYSPEAEYQLKLIKKLGYLS